MNLCHNRRVWARSVLFMYCIMILLYMRVCLCNYWFIVHGLTIVYGLTLRPSNGLHNVAVTVVSHNFAFGFGGSCMNRG